MDPADRAALVDKRERLLGERRREEQLQGLQDFRAALTAAGEPFEILYWGEEPVWSPRWIPAGYSRVPWEQCPPDEEIWVGGDKSEIGRAFGRALLRYAAPEDSLLFVFEGRLASFRMARSVAERHTEAVVGGGLTPFSPLWVTSPPKQWLIEISWEAVRVGGGAAADDVG
jgi:hypothetical protein